MSGSVMSDLGNAESPAPSPSPDIGGGPAYIESPAEIAQMRTTWLSHGYSADVFNKAYPPGGTQATAPAASTQEGVASGDGTEGAKVGISGLTETEARALAAQLLASGVDPATVAAALKAEGFDPPTPEPDDRSDEQRDHDANHLMDREYEPSDYPSYDLILAFKEAGIADRAAPEGIAAWQNFLASANVPPNMGVGLVSQWLREARVYNAMSDGERALYRAEQRAQALIAAGGEERLQERGRLRDLALQHMLRTPGTASVIAEMVSSGVIYSNFTFSSLAAIGANLESWMQNMPADAPKGTRR